MDDSVKGRLLKSMMQMRTVTPHTMFHHLPHHINLQMTELFALAKIETDGEGITSAQLQKQLRINKSAVSQMLSSLEQKGYLERKINESDRRRMDLCVTDSGREAMEAMKVHVGTITDLILDRFGEEKAEQLATLFDELTVIFDQVLSELKDEKGEITKR